MWWWYLEADEAVDGAGRGGQYGALGAQHRRSAHVGRQRIDAVEHGDAQPLAQQLGRGGVPVSVGSG